MKILGAKINWFKGYANSPELQVIVDSLPARDELVYRKQELTNNAVLYYAMHDGGYVDFFVHNPRNETGFGGATFNGKLDTGGTFSVKGPWSSGSDVANSYFPASVEVEYIIPQKEYDYRLHGHILESVAIPLIYGAGADYDYKFSNRGAYYLVIRHNGMTYAESQKFKNEGK